MFFWNKVVGISVIQNNHRYYIWKRGLQMKSKNFESSKNEPFRQEFTHTSIRSIFRLVSKCRRDALIIFAQSNAWKKKLAQHLHLIQEIMKYLLILSNWNQIRMLSTGVSANRAILIHEFELRKDGAASSCVCEKKVFGSDDITCTKFDAVIFSSTTC